MALELQIRSSVLAELAVSSVQEQLLVACFPPTPLGFVDHVDVGAAPVGLEPAGEAVRLRVPLDVFVVSRTDVLAAPNAVPAGASGPAHAAGAVLELKAAGHLVTMTCVAVEPDVPGFDQAAMVASVGAATTLDLGPALERFGLPDLALATVELVDGVVAIRLGPDGPAAGHLFPGQDWGLYLDGAAVEQLALSKVPSDLSAKIDGLRVSPHWRPDGTTPHVDVDYSGQAPAPDPFAGDVDGTLSCDFSLSPPPVLGLRTSVTWSLHVDLGTLVPAFVDDIVASVIAGSLDPTTFGGSSTGARSFTLDTGLPGVSFGGARLRYDSVLAAPEGMTLGGAVLLPLAPDRATLRATARPFGLPVRTTFCRELAKSGSGDPSQVVLLSEVSTTGSVWLDDLGRWCGVEVVSPGSWVETFLRPPATFPEVVITIPSKVALGIHDPVRLIVRTARGVRLLDLGVPPRVAVDAEGHVTNAVVNHIPNCLVVNVEHGLTWYLGHPDDPGSLNPPPEHPDWVTLMTSHPGVDVQLVTLGDLEPGELVRFSSVDHTVEVSADRFGRALLPVLLPVQAHQPSSSLVRLNRARIAGHVDVESVLLEAVSSVPAPLGARLRTDDRGGPLLVVEQPGHLELHTVDEVGATVLVGRESTGGRRDEPQPLGDGEVELNPQPLPPVDDGPRSWGRFDLPGLVGVTTVPGFPDAPVALALLEDGSTLVLDRDDRGQVRVAGTFEGPIGTVVVQGPWAFTSVDGRAAILRLRRV
ncbi:hypothetical protein [Microlunatus antarcticus]|uniref:Uncharacterized protein n=1 Tax=Microlunatus antarcticus TaxID=53388 RepID=A0A7W5JUP3_9ACTN|nr:hypothetical protein [Microlunatus antarcticus]MBB3326641.1 hypothetical protein [Microlunatus antarcticus]